MEKKEDFCSELNKVMESILKEERGVIGADVNGHISEGNRGDEDMMDRYGVKEWNVEGRGGFCKMAEYVFHEEQGTQTCV